MYVCTYLFAHVHLSVVVVGDDDDDDDDEGII